MTFNLIQTHTLWKASYFHVKQREEAMERSWKRVINCNRTNYLKLQRDPKKNS